MQRRVISFLSVFVLLYILACTQPDALKKRVKEELAKGIRKDSLFLGFHFGMTQENFFAHCRTLNGKDTLLQGDLMPSVEYKIKGLKRLARMNFYPSFYKGKLYQLPATVSYDSWAPWNKQLGADSLLHDLLKMYERTYDKPFFIVKKENSNQVYIAIDGNRCISIFKENDMAVNVLFSDLTVTGTALKSK